MASSLRSCDCLGSGENITIGLYTRGGRTMLTELNPDKASGNVTRRLNAAGDASFTFTLEADGFDVCCDEFENLYQWATEVIVSWDGEIIYGGPVIEPSFNYGIVSFQSTDLSAWFEKTPLPGLTSSGTTLASLFRRYVDFAEAENDLNYQAQIVYNNGNTLDREYLTEDYRLISEEIDDLVSAGLDWTFVGRNLLYGDPQISDYVVTLSDDDWVNPPSLVAAGASQATTVIVKAQIESTDVDGNTTSTPIVGIATDPIYEAAYGKLVRVFDGGDRVKSVADANLMARNILASIKEPIVVEPGASVLKPSAPVCINELVPGYLVRYETTTACRQFPYLFRISEVNISVNGEVSLVLVNAGLLDNGQLT